MLILLNNVLRSAENVRRLSQALLSLEFLHEFKIFKGFNSVWVGNAFAHSTCGSAKVFA